MEGGFPELLVLEQRSKRKQRKTGVRDNVDLASLPAPPGFLNGLWVQVHGGSITGADVACVALLRSSLPPLRDDDSAYSTFLLLYPGCLALSCFG